MKPEQAFASSVRVKPEDKGTEHEGIDTPIEQRHQA